MRKFVSCLASSCALYFIACGCGGDLAPSAPAAANAEVGPEAVFFLTGGPLDLHSPEHGAWLERLRAEVQAERPQAVFSILHNSAASDLCLSLTAGPRGRRLILVGHSFGAQAGINVAHCLAEHDGPDVDLLLTLDTIQVPWSPPGNVVPANVRANANRFQTRDLLLRGYRLNARSDGSGLGIDNAEVSVPGIWNAHMQIIPTLIGSGEIQALIAGALKD